MTGVQTCALPILVKILKDLDNLSVAERWALHNDMLPIVEHNYNHFYRGGLIDILWPELLNMLKEINV